MKTAITALALAFLAGCATVPVPMEQAKRTPADRLYAFQSPHRGEFGRVVVLRDDGAVLSGCGMVVYVNGRRAGMLAAGERADFYVPAGEVTLGVGLSERGLCTTAAIRTIGAVVRPGHERAYRISTEAGHFFLSPYVVNEGET